MAQSILIVSDSSSLSRMLSITLKGGGYDAINSCEPSDALVWLSKNKAHLILVDMDMAAMDGVAFVEDVRCLPACRFTPVVMLTAVVDDEVRRRGLNAGIKHWISKPFQPHHLLATVYVQILL
ncbi:response regulator [Pseudomonas sp. KFB-139]|uniref:Response regulator n=1 Tax=Pseudomonas serbiensis TaxID=3064350 RepID=A0ABT9CXN2_9PSED|nr:response regulator [Pseudomonas sp. KFB-138]MDO7930266.1 response regulator [Pseudomonas sp. KFB-138]